MGRLIIRQNTLKNIREGVNMFKRLQVASLLPVLLAGVGCVTTSADGRCKDAGGDVAETKSADGNQTQAKYFDIDLSGLSPELTKIVIRGWKYAEKSLSSEQLLAMVRKKNDWTFPPTEAPLTGEYVAESIEHGKSIDGSVPIKPRVKFYRSPRWGRDVCNGFSAGPLHQTAATGCTKRGTIYKNTNALGDSPEVLGEFFVHEWLHVAGFDHDGNDNQCSAEKRNSVPIYVACVAANLESAQDLARCSLACE
jgi:hypothetical protein